MVLGSKTLETDEMMASLSLCKQEVPTPLYPPPTMALLCPFPFKGSPPPLTPPSRVLLRPFSLCIQGAPHPLHLPLGSYCAPFPYHTGSPLSPTPLNIPSPILVLYYARIIIQPHSSITSSPLLLALSGHFELFFNSAIE